MRYFETLYGQKKHYQYVRNVVSSPSTELDLDWCKRGEMIGLSWGGLLALRVLLEDYTNDMSEMLHMKFCGPINPMQPQDNGKSLMRVHDVRKILKKVK